MSYTPTNWATGDIITAEKLNNMESGIANKNIIIASIASEDAGQTYTCDKTVAEMKNFLEAGGVVFASVPQPPYHLIPLKGVMEPPNTVVILFEDNSSIINDGSVTISIVQISVSHSNGSEQDYVTLVARSATIQTT